MRNKLITIFFAAVIGVLVTAFYVYYVRPRVFKSAREQFAVAADYSMASSSHSVISLASNQWYSSIYGSFPSQPLYALPLVYKLTDRGLGFSYPFIEKRGLEILGKYSEDFVIGTGGVFERSRIVGISDWAVSAEITDNSQDIMRFTLGHGIPYTTVTSRTNRLFVYFPNDFSVYDGDFKHKATSGIKSRHFAVVSNNNVYIFALPQHSSLNIQPRSLTIDGAQSVFVGLLDKRENFKEFLEISSINILDTQVYSSVDNDNLQVQYQVKSDMGTPLIALYPHQYENLKFFYPVVGEYQTVRGILKLIKTDSFMTNVPLVIPKTSFDRLKNNPQDLIDQVVMDSNKIISEGNPPTGVYFLGTYFGKIASLISLSDTLDLPQTRTALINYIEPIFYKSLVNFRYDSNKTSLIAKNPEFGNENLNDHHFHYGYYIRLASVLANYDLQSMDVTKEVVNEMAHDIATTRRNDKKYPYLRNFDTYESHSWADGFANSIDGNNQESSSEAINAWYALYLWGKATNDDSLKRYALYLYNSEIQGANYYWWDKNFMYKDPYMHGIASRVWGGKIDFHTWFSEEANMIYGIQLLPITPASEYLGSFQNFFRYEDDYRKSGGSEAKEWGDLFTIWKSFYKPQEALEMKDSVVKPHGDTPRSLFLYMLYLNNSKEK